MNTEINDLRVVVKAAARKGRNVAMGGHSLGRLDRHRLRDLGLQRQAGRQATSPAWC